MRYSREQPKTSKPINGKGKRPSTFQKKGGFQWDPGVEGGNSANGGWVPFFVLFLLGKSIWWRGPGESVKRLTPKMKVAVLNPFTKIRTSKGRGATVMRPLHFRMRSLIGKGVPNTLDAYLDVSVGEEKGDLRHFCK